MSTKLNRWGNSLGIRLPQYVVERSALAAGDYLYITLKDNGEIVIRPVKAKEAPKTTSAQESSECVAKPISSRAVW